MFRVLLVDDEEEFVLALAERLRLRDFEIEVALDGERALEAVQHREPEVVVLDLKMPGMNGLDVLRSIKKSHPSVQVIILTGHGSERDRDAACTIGAFQQLQKPVDIRELVSTINQAFLQRTEG